LTSELAFQLEEDLAEAVSAIRADTVLGPIALARLGVDVVLRLTEKAHYERPLHIWMEVQGLTRALLVARPECMPVVNLASAVVQPLPELYGRGKDEGARMRADLRARTLDWLAALDARAARIDALRATLNAFMARAVTGDAVYLVGEAPASQRIAIAGPEKFVPSNYDLPATGLTRVPLQAVGGILTGDGDRPSTIESIRNTIASLRFASTLL
jgi:hypothetical protein